MAKGSSSSSAEPHWIAEKILLSAIAVLVVIGGVAYYLGYQQTKQEQAAMKDSPRTSVLNFEECVAAGNPVMESYPRQCRSQDGALFVEALSPEGGTEKTCEISGCSGQLCGEPGEGLVSTCEFREEYRCVRLTACERQSDGKCGWTQTPEYLQCLEKSASY